MNKYLIRIQSIPESQHPLRYLEAVTDRPVEEVIEKYGVKKHNFTWELDSIEEVEQQDPYMQLIKYKYGEGDPINANPEQDNG